MASLSLGVGGGLLGAEIGSFFPGIGTLSGAAIGFAVGAMIGSAAGSFIDQQFLFPAIFGRDSRTLYGPQIADFQITGANPGAPIAFCLGRQNRIAGTIIWMSPVRKVSHENAVGGKGGGNVVSYDYFFDIAIAVCEGPISAVRRVWADGKLVYDNGQVDNRYDSIVFYDGTQTSPDPTIQAQEGVGNTPAFIGTAYFVINNFALHDWGNRVPNFNMLVEAQNQALLSDAISAIWSRGGRPETEIDTSWVRDVEVQGYTIATVQPPQKMLEPLLLTYDVIAQERDGVVYFSHRKDSTPITIDAAKLAAYEEASGDSNARAVKVTDLAGFDLPRGVIVTYVDPAMNWQKGSQPVRRQGAPAPTSLTMDVPLVIDGNTAKSLAKRLLWSAWGERKIYEFSLPPSQLHLLESDLLTMVTDSATYKGRITKLDRGNNYVLEFTASSEQAAVLTQTATADIPSLPAEPPPQGKLFANLVMMEVPVLMADDYGRGFHWAVFRTNAGDEWKGGRVWISFTGSTGTYTLMQDGEFRQEATGGQMTNGTVLPTAIGTVPFGRWDLVTTIDVNFVNGSPQTLPDSSVLLGFNHLYVGPPDGTGEIIAYVNATQVTGTIWRLSKLLRGRYGTEDRYTNHTTNDMVVCLDPSSGVKWHKYDIEIGKTDYYKAVPTGTTLADVTTSVGSTRICRSVTPWSPGQLKAVRQDNGDIIFSWVRRPNTPFAIFNFPDAANPSNNFSTEEYDVEVCNNVGTVIRTQRVTSLTNYTYSMAQQNADVLPSAQYKAAVLADTPAVYYRLGETSGTAAADSSGNARNGTYAGTYTLNQTGALLRGGDNDPSVLFGGGRVNPAYLMNAAKATIEAWIYPTSYSTAGQIAGCFNGYGSSTFEKSLTLQVGGTIQFYGYDGGAHTATSTMKVNLNQWNHVVGVADGVNVYVYINGVLAATTACGNTYTSYTVPNLFVADGGWYTGTGSAPAWNNGFIDEVAFYPTNLSTARIQAHWFAGIQGKQMSVNVYQINRNLGVNNTRGVPASIPFQV